ncbi:MAG: hypothetical protein IT385_05975 [Deltaproteobacteria bacterium]|nr:hypothetical protein [Deltaproteobacteria bacterium]
MARTRSIVVASALGVLTASPALAGDPKILPTESEVKREVEKKPSPWDPSLVFGLNVALSTATNVVGQPHGSSISGGLSLQAGLDFVEDAIDWRNVLKINEVYSRTPIVDEFVKSTDVLTFESTLYYLLSDIFGPFATFKLDTAIFSGHDVRPAPVDYALGGETIATATTSIKLTDPFQPLSLKEAVGVFIGPLSKPELEVDIRAGFGAIQTFAEGGRVVTDDAATPAIELSLLEDVIQAGAVLGVEAKGVLDDKRVVYSAHAEVMFPVVNDDPAERDVIDLTNVDIGAKLGFKLFEFASLDYELKIFRQPQLIDAWQIQNTLFLNFKFTAIE